MFVLCGFYDPSWGVRDGNKKTSYVGRKGKTLIPKTAAVNSSIVKQVVYRK